MQRSWDRWADVKDVLEQLRREQAEWTGKYVDDHVTEALAGTEGELPAPALRSLRGGPRQGLLPPEADDRGVREADRRARPRRREDRFRRPGAEEEVRAEAAVGGSRDGTGTVLRTAPEGHDDRRGRLAPGAHPPGDDERRPEDLPGPGERDVRGRLLPRARSSPRAPSVTPRNGRTTSSWTSSRKSSRPRSSGFSTG